MSGFVSEFVGSADKFIGIVSTSGFSAVLQAVNGSAAAAAIVALILLSLNQFLQLNQISMSRYMSLMIKLVAISYIGLRWSNFSTISDAIQNGMDYISVKLLTMSMPSDNVTLAGAIDNIISILSDKSTEMMDHSGYIGGAFMGSAVTFMLGLIGCLGSLIIIYSKIMVSVYICIAPMFIACLIFDSFKDYFYRWLQGAITYTLYPVITSTVLGMVYTVCMGYLNQNSSTTVETASSFFAFIAVAMIMLAVIALIPTIVASLTGMVQHANPGQFMAMGAIGAKGVGSSYSWMRQKFKSSNNNNKTDSTGGSAGAQTAQRNPSKTQERNDRILGNS